jgi:hypothetical protein
VLLRLSYLPLTNAVAFVRLLPMNDVDKDVEILVLRHQLAVLQRQIDEPHLAPPDRALSRPTCTDLPRPTLRRLHLIVSPTQSCAGTATSSATGTARRPARDGLTASKVDGVIYLRTLHPPFVMVQLARRRASLTRSADV